MTSEKFDLAVDNLIDVVINKYNYVEDSKIDPYAVFEDFSERFLACLDENDLLEVWRDSYFKLESLNVPVWHSLASSFNVPIYKLYRDLLENDSDAKRRLEFIRVIGLVMGAWPAYDFLDMDADDKSFFKDVFRSQGIVIPGLD